MDENERNLKIKDRNSINTIAFLIILIIILGGVFAYKILNKDSNFITIGSDNNIETQSNKNDTITVANGKANDYRISRINEAVSLIKSDMYTAYYTGEDMSFSDYADGSLMAEKLYEYLADADIINSVNDIKVEVTQSSSGTTFSFSFPQAKNLDLSRINEIEIDFWKE